MCTNNWVLIDTRIRQVTIIGITTKHEYVVSRLYQETCITTSWATSTHEYCLLCNWIVISQVGCIVQWASHHWVSAWQFCKYYGTCTRPTGMATKLWYGQFTIVGLVPAQIHQRSIWIWKWPNWRAKMDPCHHTYNMATLLQAMDWAIRHTIQPS